MHFTTINPSTQAEIRTYQLESAAQIEAKLAKAWQAGRDWARASLHQRIRPARELIRVLHQNAESYAVTMAQEMGKNIHEARAEIEKCCWMIEVQCDHAHEWLGDLPLSADGLKHFSRPEPLGAILSIMPWNFPFWQALRFGIPTLLAGNTSLLKHSNVTPECSLQLAKAFQTAGFPEGVFQSLIIDHQSTERLIGDSRIAGVSLTGSTSAGKQVASTCGQHLKKCVLELGGSDPFIVLSDADVEAAAQAACLGRLLNNGQSCIAAKRYLVHQSIEGEFTGLVKEMFEQKKWGDALDETCQLGPLVNKSAREFLHAQVERALQAGAKLITGGNCSDETAFYPPTLLSGLDAAQALAQEEIFGPVASIYSFKNEKEAIRLANLTPFGLGASVWSKDLEKAESFGRDILAGCFFVNSIVKSDPRIPFGGVKESGYGRELGPFGIKEFCNLKSYNIYQT